MNALVTALLALAASSAVGAEVRFSVEVQAAFTKAGCNQGTCHGNANGKGGLKLSLRGEDADFDYFALTRGAFARRFDVNTPESSLLLLKAIGTLPHQGGIRFDAGSWEYAVVFDWIAGGARFDPPGSPAIDSLTVEPAQVLLAPRDATVQLAVRARFSDGSTRDVTAQACFDSSSPVATVDAGKVDFNGAGETAVLVRYLGRMAVARIARPPEHPDYKPPTLVENNFIDRLVFAKLRQMRTPPSPPSTDEVFLRRAFVDIIGVLPEPAEVRAFLADTATDKRSKLVDALLARPEYADWWALKWADVLRADPLNLDPDGAARFVRKLRRDLSSDKPLDRFAFDLLAGNGSTYSEPDAAFHRIHRDPDELAENVAQLFLGIRLKCARCHNHPFERYTQDDYFGLAAFFARTGRKMIGGYNRPPDNFVAVQGEELIFNAPAGETLHIKTGAAVRPRMPGDPARGLAAKVFDEEPVDRRTLFAQELTRADNPFFARVLANRIWAHLMGRGIVEPVDDFRDSNPPANPELLDALADELVRSKFSAKSLIRTIAGSRVYQLSSQPLPDNEDDESNFSHASARLLGAESLLDAISQTTQVPEPFVGLPPGTRAVQIPAGSTRTHPFLKLFGKPQRLTVCECERSGETTLVQSFALIGGPVVAVKLASADNRVGRLIAKRLDDAAIIEELYLAALARPPTAQELADMKAHVGSEPDRRKALEDVLWALLNSKGFLFRR